MASSNFFKNFRESTDPIIIGRNPYGESNIPGLGKNHDADWEERVAIPFSYVISDGGKRQYGTIYAPYYEAKKLKKDGTVKADDLEIYGADLVDGLSMTADGFKKLFEENKNNDFRIENGATNGASRATEKNKSKLVYPSVKVNDAPFFKNLRDILTTLQRGGGA